MSTRILLLTQENCASCNQTREILQRLAHEYPVDIETLDFNSPEGQMHALRGGMMFPPGVVIDGQPFSYGRPSEGKLRR
ncbi:MAG: thioredoxin family protein, partial [Deinococcus sp.]